MIGRPAKAWLSSALRGTLHTPAFLKEFGLIAYCDYLNDDQPYLIDTIHGPIVCVPYSNDINDFNMFARGGLSTRDGIEMLKLCFNQLHAEGAAAGRIMNVGCIPMSSANRTGSRLCANSSITPWANRKSGSRPASKSPPGILRKRRATFPDGPDWFETPGKGIDRNHRNRRARLPPCLGRVHRRRFVGNSVGKGVTAEKRPRISILEGGRSLRRVPLSAFYKIPGLTAPVLAACRTEVSNCYGPSILR